VLYVGFVEIISDFECNLFVSKHICSEELLEQRTFLDKPSDYIHLADTSQFFTASVVSHVVLKLCINKYTVILCLVR